MLFSAAVARSRTRYSAGRPQSFRGLRPLHAIRRVVTATHLLRFSFWPEYRSWGPLGGQMGGARGGAAGVPQGHPRGRWPGELVH